MGYYINRVGDNNAPARGKASFLVMVAAAKRIPTPTEFVPNLVCVVDNGFFDTAGCAFSPEEMQVFLDSQDPRPKTWLIVPDAAKLAK